jgi:hypothetical protein
MGFAPVLEWSNTHMKTLSIYFDYHEKDKYAKYVPENYILCLLADTLDDEEINRELVETAIKEAIEKLGLRVRFLVSRRRLLMTRSTRWLLLKTSLSMMKRARSVK